MPNRTEAADIRAIIETSVSDADLTPYMDAAHILVEAHLGTSGLAEEHLRELERWLAAHLLACSREQQPMSESIGGASISYRGQTGLRLDATLYGQQVALLDTTGRLAALGKRCASMYAITSER